MLYSNNKCADQPAHPRSLISPFVVRCLDSIILIDAISKISSVAGQASLRINLIANPQDRFSRDVAHFILIAVQPVPDLCGAVPSISHAWREIMTRVSGPPYKEGTIVFYYCNNSQTPVGSNKFFCTGGEWVGGSFSCEPMTTTPPSASTTIVASTTKTGMVLM